MIRPATEKERSKEVLAAGTLSRLRATIVVARLQPSAASMVEFRRPLVDSQIFIKGTD